MCKINTGYLICRWDSSKRKDILVIVYSGSRLYAKSISQQSNISQGGENMKVIRNISAEDAAKKLEVSAAEKFVANETASSCLCRCSDG